MVDEDVVVGALSRRQVPVVRPADAARCDAAVEAQPGVAAERAERHRRVDQPHRGSVVTVDRVVPTGVDPRDPAVDGVIGDSVERTPSIAGAVVPAAERSADHTDALIGEPIDQRVVVGLGGGAPGGDLCVGRHVLHHLDDGRAVIVTAAIDPVEELPGAVRTSRETAGRDVGDRCRAHLADAPVGVDVEEVDDADLDAGPCESRRMPVVGVRDADLGTRRRPEEVGVRPFRAHIEVNRSTDPSAELADQLADRHRRHPHQHQPARRGVDDRPADRSDDVKR